MCAHPLKHKNGSSSFFCSNLFLSRFADSPLYQPWQGWWNTHHCKHHRVPTVLRSANVRTAPKVMNFILIRKALEWSHLCITEQNRCCRFPEKSSASAFLFKILPVLLKMPCHYYQRWNAIDWLVGLQQINTVCDCLLVKIRYNFTNGFFFPNFENIT